MKRAAAHPSLLAIGSLRPRAARRARRRRAVVRCDGREQIRTGCTVGAAVGGGGLGLLVAWREQQRSRGGECGGDSEALGVITR